jgi:excisionase family DNA binding protein
MAKKYLTIKEASKILGVTPLTLRNWEKRGKLIPYRHPFNKYRLYTSDQILSLLRRIESGNKIRDIR